MTDLNHAFHRHLPIEIDGFEIRTCTSAWSGRILRVAFRRVGTEPWIIRDSNDLDGLMQSLLRVNA